MSDLVQYSWHRALGLSRLLEQFKDKPQLEKLLSIYLDSIQQLEDAAWQVRELRQLANAQGAQLDALGRIVGEARKGRDDTSYQLWIGIRIRLNRSQGKPVDVIELLSLATVTPFKFVEHDNAHFSIEFDGTPNLLSDLTLLTFLGKAAGVSFDLLFSSDTGFLFKNVGASDDPAHGFGSAV